MNKTTSAPATVYTEKIQKHFFSILEKESARFSDDGSTALEAEFMHIYFVSQDKNRAIIVYDEGSAPFYNFIEYGRLLKTLESDDSYLKSELSDFILR